MRIMVFTTSQRPRRKCTNRALLSPGTPQSVSRGRRVDSENLSRPKVVWKTSNRPCQGPKRVLKRQLGGAAEVDRERNYQNGQDRSLGHIALGPGKSKNRRIGPIAHELEASKHPRVKKRANHQQRDAQLANRGRRYTASPTGVVPMISKSNISRQHAGSEYTVENDLEKMAFWGRQTSPSSCSATTKQIRDRHNYFCLVSV
jgi:hypothetical protein